MTKMRDPYLAGWNEAIETAANRIEMEKDDRISYAKLYRIADEVRGLAKPEPKG